MSLYFSDIFHVQREHLDTYGAFDISLLTDLPLFIDPFLLFHSTRPQYQQLHQSIITYLRFLADKSAAGPLHPGQLLPWFFFPEVKQNWLGFTASGNAGRGLGHAFATALNRNLGALFGSFGQERITRGTHLEKLTIIKDGVGRDTISDFTTNLIKEYLLDYTQSFARERIDPSYTARVTVGKVRFNYSTENWERDTYTLPVHAGDYVILTPSDLLTRDDTWINRSDYIQQFFLIPAAIPNAQLRAEVNNYLASILPRDPRRKDIDRAITETTLKFPVLVDYFIRREGGQRRPCRRAESQESR